MVASCRLLNKEPESVANTIKEIIDLANKNLLAKPYHPKVIFKYKNVAINATLLVQRLRDMEMLRNAVGQYENPVQFKLPVLLPLWTPFRDFWGPQDDAMITLGCVWYGFGNWEKLRMDSRLNLTYKLNTSSSTMANVSQLPNPTQLYARIQLILKAMRDPSAVLPPHVNNNNNNNFPQYNYMSTDYDYQKLLERNPMIRPYNLDL